MMISVLLLKPWLNKTLHHILLYFILYRTFQVNMQHFTQQCQLKDLLFNLKIAVNIDRSNILWLKSRNAILDHAYISLCLPRFIFRCNKLWQAQIKRFCRKIKRTEQRKKEITNMMCTKVMCTVLFLHSRYERKGERGEREREDWCVMPSQCCCSCN